MKEQLPYICLNCRNKININKGKCPYCDAVDDFTTIEGYASMKVAVKNIANLGKILMEKDRKSKDKK